MDPCAVSMCADVYRIKHSILLYLESADTLVSDVQPDRVGPQLGRPLSVQDVVDQQSSEGQSKSSPQSSELFVIGAEDERLTVEIHESTT